jgi:hypothetical protein
MTFPNDPLPNTFSAWKLSTPMDFEAIVSGSFVAEGSLALVEAVEEFVGLPAGGS